MDSARRMEQPENHIGKFYNFLILEVQIFSSTYARRKAIRVFENSARSHLMAKTSIRSTTRASTHFYNSFFTNIWGPVSHA